MIRHWLSNNNESTTVLFPKKFRELKKTLVKLEVVLKSSLEVILDPYIR
jgi:hypothetical protein